MMGELGDLLGYYAAGVALSEGGEALTVADGREAWMFHILPANATVRDDDDDPLVAASVAAAVASSAPTSKTVMKRASAVWAAMRLNDGEVSVSANAFVIRGVPAASGIGQDGREYVERRARAEFASPSVNTNGNNHGVERIGCVDLSRLAGLDVTPSTGLAVTKLCGISVRASVCVRVCLSVSGCVSVCLCMSQILSLFFSICLLLLLSLPASSPFTFSSLLPSPRSPFLPSSPSPFLALSVSPFLPSSLSPFVPSSLPPFVVVGLL